MYNIGRIYTWFHTLNRPSTMNMMYENVECDKADRVVTMKNPSHEEEHGIVFQSKDYASNLLTSMFELWQEKITCDIVVKISGTAFNAH